MLRATSFSSQHLPSLRLRPQEDGKNPTKQAFPTLGCLPPWLSGSWGAVSEISLMSPASSSDYADLNAPPAAMQALPVAFDAVLLQVHTHNMQAPTGLWFSTWRGAFEESLG